MRAGDKILIFGNPAKFTHYMGQATLVSKVSDWGWMEKWKAQFDDEILEVLISKRSNMKPIKGHEDYAISEDGQVYSFKKARLLRPQIDKIYNRVSIKFEEETNVYPISRLVMETWSDPCPGEEYQVFHIDRNRMNNHYSNLKWITNSQAKIYARANSHKDMEIQRTLLPPQIPLDARWIQITAEKRRKPKLYFMSIQQAEEYLKIPRKKIMECIDENKQHDGWTFKRL